MFDHKFRYLGKNKIRFRSLSSTGKHWQHEAADHPPSFREGAHAPKSDLALPEDDQANDPHEDSAFDAIKKNEDDESTVEMLLSWNSAYPNRGGNSKKYGWCEGEDKVTFQEKVHLENVWRDQESALRKHHNYEEEDFEES